MDATYISTTSFSVVGDFTKEFNYLRMIQANCGVDNYKVVIVISSTYSSPNTTVVVGGEELTSNLSNVLFGTPNPQTQIINPHQSLFTGKI